jgi:uncharacterized protein YqfB (UPF0267 family)
MKKETVYKLIIVLLVLINGVTLFFALNRKKHQDMRTELVNILQLEGEPKAKVLDLQKSHFKIKDQLILKNRVKYDSLFGLLKNESIDTIISNRLLDELSQNHANIEKMTYQHFMDVAKQCNNEQKERLIETVFRAFDKNMPPPKHD